MFRSVLAVPILLMASVLSPAQSTNASPQTDRPVFKATARTVIVDVVVTDKHGNPVTGLKREEFSTLENGKPQSIVFFESHTAAGSTSAVAPLIRHLPPRLFTNVPPAPVTDSVNVLLLDALNTLQADQAKVRQQMIQCLKTIPPGRRIAIFALSSDLRLIQGFTDDTSVLLAAIDSRKSKALPSTSALLVTPQDDDLRRRNEDAKMEALYLLPPDPAHAAMVKQVLEESIANLQRFQADQAATQIDIRVQQTLRAMEALGRYLGGIPISANLTVAFGVSRSVC